MQDVCVLLALLNLVVDHVIGPDAVFPRPKVVELLAEMGLRWQLAVGSVETVPVRVHVRIGEVAIGAEGEVVFALDGAVLRDDVLVCCAFLAFVFAVEDVGFAG